MQTCDLLQGSSWHLWELWPLITLHWNCVASFVVWSLLWLLAALQAILPAALLLFALGRLRECYSEFLLRFLIALVALCHIQITKSLKGTDLKLQGPVNFMQHVHMHLAQCPLESCASSNWCGTNKKAADKREVQYI